MSNLPIHYQFEIKAMQTQIDQMSTEQLREFAHRMAEHIHVQKFFIQDMNRANIAGERWTFTPLDPKNFNPPAQ